ncbi:unnamed protein product [Dracunculus medinensis]|uniref:H/ACA ribonucleoprotein complex subunit n=1 Tax=Dracunculus medinensis TaxID=318479 RepID=A0A0N4U8B3_DRAME|nr:unnamed protein product [Dracunculus medinensis]
MVSAQRRGRSWGDGGNRRSYGELGYFSHKCENDIICNTVIDKVPYFNAPVYFENKEQIGKVDEIFGKEGEHGFSVKLDSGLQPSSFTVGQKIYINTQKLLSYDRIDQPRGRGGNRGGIIRSIMFLCIF